MRLIFIRHAEPDYARNSLTEKGFREAELLAPRLLKLDRDVDAVYTSPLARAFLTAEPYLKVSGRSAVTLPWLHEFSYRITSPENPAKKQVPWDFMPDFWTEREDLYDRKNFYKDAVLQSAPEYAPAVLALRRGLDEILASYGYHRKGAYYETDDSKVKDDEDKTVLFFAHLGTNGEALGYLLGISPIVLQQSFYLAPTSLCAVNFEKRKSGIAAPRAQIIGDTMHLALAGEPISKSGAFSELLNG